MKIRSLVKGVSGALLAGTIGLGASTAWSIPELQLYIEGATYDTSTEDWVLDVSTASSLRLWAIGNVDGEGGAGAISDVNLAIAYDSGATPTFTLTPSTTGDLHGFLDPSTPQNPTLTETGADGSVPTFSDGTTFLPTHGVYGTGVAWQEFALGDFTLTDSPMSDFINTFPTEPSPPTSGQINVYEIGYTGLAGSSIHFDLYNNVMSGNGGVRLVKAPFSHDATGTGSSTSSGSSSGPPGQIPEPSSIALIGLGMLGAGFAYRKRRKAQDHTAG